VAASADVATAVRCLLVAAHLLSAHFKVVLLTIVKMSVFIYFKYFSDQIFDFKFFQSLLTFFIFI